MSSRLRWVPFAAASVIAATAISVALRPALAPVNLAMIYIIALVAVAARADRGTAAVTSIFCAAAFDFFCVPPYLTFTVNDSEYIITFAAMLAIALVISAQTDRIRTHAQDASAREARFALLHKLTNRLSGETRVFEAAQAAAELGSSAFPANVVIFLPDQGRFSFDRRTAVNLPVPAGEEALAAAVFQSGQPARSAALYLPLRGAHGNLGVMAVVPPLTDDDSLHAFADQTALALERIQNRNSAASARLDMQTEQMRSSLLSAISHDLRTPLSTIAGSASALRDPHSRLTPETRQELLEGISIESERLSRLISNLLDMTRFETGAPALRLEVCPLEDIAGTALQRLEPQLREHDVRVSIPSGLALVHVDEVLIGQVFLNVLENAAKYAPPRTSIEITAESKGQAVTVTIRDHGPGLRPGDIDRIFDKFYRSRTAGAHGAGLGLAISKAVIEAHGGRIEAFNHPQGGAVFQFTLPASTIPVEQPQ